MENDVLLDLYVFADENNIDVYYFPMKKCKGMVFSDSTIAIDVDKLETSAEETELLACELGHLETGSFNNIYSNLQTIAKNEVAADRWAIRRLIPLGELKKALKSKILTKWELAEYFGVTEKFIEKAVNYYKLKEVI